MTIPKYFDTDQHLTEPPDFWTGRIPKKFAEREPRFMHHPTMGPGWSWDNGKTVRPMGVQSVGSEDPRKIGNFKSFEEIDPGCYDPKKRIEVMDIDGCGATLLFPSGVGFFYGLPDDEFYLATAQAYNDAALDWATAADAKRVFPTGMIPMNTMEMAMSETRRIAKKGYKHYLFNRWPSGAPMPTAEDDKYFSVVEEVGITGSMHGFGSGRAAVRPISADTRKEPEVQKVDPKARGTAAFAGLSQELVAASRGAGLGITGPIASFIFAGVLDRHPKMKLSFVETSLGWAPYLAEAMDKVYMDLRWQSGIKLNRKPSEYFNEIYRSFDREWFGVKYRDYVGVDKMTFGTDFPHIGSFYPHSRFYIELVMQGCTPEEMEKILWSNAARIYGVN